MPENNPNECNQLKTERTVHAFQQPLLDWNYGGKKTADVKSWSLSSPPCSSSSFPEDGRFLGDVIKHPCCQDGGFRSLKNRNSIFK